jgi:hypothetical protein
MVGWQVEGVFWGVSRRRGGEAGRFGLVGRMMSFSC